MYKVLLVDDEPWALKGIRDFFNWEESGFKVIAETTRSIEALDIILTQKPDVVFTDIRMPSISGIELMQKTREEGLDTEFIVVSGYSDFSYAQKAIKLGAFDYCLKPMDSDYAGDLLLKLAEHLQQITSIYNSKIFEAIVENSQDFGMLLIESGLSTSCTYYQAVILQGKKSVDSNNEFLSSLPFENDHCIALGRNKFLYIVNTNSDISYALDVKLPQNVTLGFSALTDSPNDALQLYHQANIAAAGSFLNDEKTIFKYNKKDVGILNEEIDKLSLLLKNGYVEGLQQSILNLPTFFIVNDFGMEELVYFWNKLVAEATQYINERDFSSVLEFMDYSRLLNHFEDITALCECLSNELTYLVGNEYDNQIVSESMNRDFQKLFSYINDHFTEQLYLKDLSKSFFINQNYVCNLFKKYTGGTFSEYINGLRLAKSKELLEDINLTIEEVAHESGYNDYYYFNKLFKKHFNITPAKYRKDLTVSKSAPKGMINNGVS